MTARSFVVLLAEQRAGTALQTARLGITVSRRVGPAVVRSRVKRRIREWFRRSPARELEGKDLVVIARPGAGQVNQAVIAQDLDDAVQRLVRRTGGA